jgi:peptidoglycan hydrolase-like protein with peptidoglycan-binding domain
VRLQGETVKDLQTIMKGLGYYTPTDGQYDDATREAFRAFIANENFEERADPDAGWIDRPVLEYLVKKLK